MQPQQHTKSKCAVFGIALSSCETTSRPSSCGKMFAVPYGDFDKKLTRCLNEGICKYKMDFGGAKICTDKEKEEKKEVKA